MRPPEVFVRVLEIEEARRLKRLATDARHRSTRIRAMILLASATEMPAPQIGVCPIKSTPHASCIWWGTQRPIQAGNCVSLQTLLEATIVEFHPHVTRTLFRACARRVREDQ